MPLMTWNDSFSTGVKGMDDQHKVLMKMLNDLHAAMLEGKTGEVTGSLLNTLVSYTRQHFRAEEALMAGAKYPALVPHCSKHKALTQQVEQFVERYQRSQAALSVDLLTFLRDWLVTHIQKEDRSYGPWMNERGVR